jgi:hypothetical protein
VTKVYTDENGNVTGYRIANFQSSGLKEFNYIFDNGDVKKGKGINWVSLRGAYQWDTPDKSGDAKAMDDKPKNSKVEGHAGRRVKSTIDVMANSSLLELWIHQQALEADKRQSQSNN